MRCFLFAEVLSIPVGFPRRGLDVREAGRASSRAVGPGGRMGTNKQEPRAVAPAGVPGGIPCKRCCLCQPGPAAPAEDPAYINTSQ